MRSIMACLTVAVGLVAACGGDTATTGIPTPDSGNGNDGSNNLDGGGNKDGTVSDANNNPDGFVDPDSGNAGDSGLISSSISCGKQTCALPSQSCCVDLGPPLIFVCAGGDAGACGQGLVDLQCASAVDCAGNNVCCLDANIDPAKATCQATCSGKDKALLCDPKANDMKNKCGDAGACGNANIDTWGLTKTYGTCGDPMGPL